MISVKNKTRGKMPPVNFAKLKIAVLGNSYDLSVALLTPTESRRVTKKVRKADKPSNVLSFPLSNQSGEILLCPSLATTQAKEYDASTLDFLSYLFIHGMLHLKGHTHGVTMEGSERQLLKRFGLHVSF